MALRRGEVMADQIAQFFYSAMPAFALFACALGACCENTKDR